MISPTALLAIFAVLGIYWALWYFHFRKLERRAVAFVATGVYGDLRLCCPDAQVSIVLSENGFGRRFARCPRMPELAYRPEIVAWVAGAPLPSNAVVIP